MYEQLDLFKIKDKISKDIESLIDKVTEMINYPPATDPRNTFINGYNFAVGEAVNVIKRWADKNNIDLKD